MHYDVFNGDADGIIALLQLRLSQRIEQPKNTSLITGVKRDISLLKQVDVTKASAVTVLDISLEKNHDALTTILEQDVDVFYVDHHRTGDIPVSTHLKTLLNTEANTCTSLLVNQYLDNEFAAWAVAAAFGDNMQQSAQILASQIGIAQEQQQLLKELGTYINYNGYGSIIDDLHFHPAELYRQLLNYEDPFVLIAEDNSIFHQLKKAYQADMEKTNSAIIVENNISLKAVRLADEAWARRVSGVFGNELANQSPEKSHVVLTLNSDDSYTVSLRAPLNNKQGAGEICAQFPTGGGRAAAAGINALPKEMLGDFIKCVSEYYA